jgi:hypothetical protein
VVTRGEGQQPGGRTEAARLEGAIDSGRTRDKVPGFDPGAAPFGTDAESAGAPAFLDGGLRTSLEPGAPAEVAADPRGNDRSRYQAQDRVVWPVVDDQIRFPRDHLLSRHDFVEILVQPKYRNPSG